MQATPATSGKCPQGNRPPLVSADVQSLGGAQRRSREDVAVPSSGRLRVLEVSQEQKEAPFDKLRRCTGVYSTEPTKSENILSKIYDAFKRCQDQEARAFMLKWIEAVPEVANKSASFQYHVGLFYLHNFFGEEERYRAYSYFVSAGSDHAGALRDLAYCYAAAVGCEKDILLAVDLYKRSIGIQPDINITNRIFICYITLGMGIDLSETPERKSLKDNYEEQAFAYGLQAYKYFSEVVGSGEYQERDKNILENISYHLGRLSLKMQNGDALSYFNTVLELKGGREVDTRILISYAYWIGAEGFPKNYGKALIHAITAVKAKPESRDTNENFKQILDCIYNEAKESLKRGNSDAFVSMEEAIDAVEQEFGKKDPYLLYISKYIAVNFQHDKIGGAEGQSADRE